MSNFLIFALLAGFLASIASGIIGSYVVAKRIVFISGSIAHSVLGGMGFFLWLSRVYHLPWATPQLGALLTALVSAFVMGWVHLKHKEREDTVIAALWSTGMAIGVIFLALTPGYKTEVMNYLFGNILWASPKDLILLLGLDIFLIVICCIRHKQFLCICFDEEQALLQGISFFNTYLLLLCLVAVSIVLLIQVVGAILVIAMLTLPAAIGCMLSKRVSHIMVIAGILGCFFSFIGITSSYYLDWPPGATISLVTTCGYLLSRIGKSNFYQNKKLKLKK